VKIAFHIAAYVVLLLSNAASAASVLHQASGITFPDVIAGFERTDIKDYESTAPGAGFQYSYHAKAGGVASVYVYTEQIKKMPTDVRHQMFGKIREQTASEIGRFAEMSGASVTKIDDSILHVGTKNGTTAVMAVSFIIQKKDEITTNTQLWIWVARNHLLKIRLTRKAESDFTAKQAYDFLEEMVRLSVHPNHI